MEERKGLILVSASYDGDNRRVLLKLYDPEKREMVIIPSNAVSYTHLTLPTNREV